jgi:GrpB-like predicted nucleotidyltransferase (UPF0157 family)
VNKNESKKSEESSFRMTEEEIISVNIGQPKVLNTTIHLADYDPAWPLVFNDLEKEIRAVLQDKVILLEHVGSTSVPGLSAKPIIDMVLAVSDSSDESSYVPTLETLGYVLKIREPEWFEHRVLKLQEPKVNLHVFTSGCEEIERMIAFRDWLRTHPKDMKLYAETKRKLSQQTWKYMQNYADAKSAVVQDIMSRMYPVKASPM